ncbi:MAG: hypothetical protein VYA86_06755 [Candidatus Thermoplasmatota archaeon]|nr:hypothetical protein [Candidatus Thermoplasmatota archaeon]
MNAKAIALGIVGILLMGINLAVISPFVMEATDEALSTATVMTNDTWEDEEWLNSTSERSFFAWNLSNAAALQSGAETEMEFEKMGPFTYDLTTKREVLYHDEEAGVLTYREYNVYEWSDGMSGDTQLTNINILFNTQKIGAAGSAIDFGSSFVKGAFTTDMLYIDLSERAPSIWVSDDITEAGEEAMRAEIDWGNSTSDNTTLHHVLYDAKDPGDSSVCIALTCDIGPMLMVRLGAPDDGAGSLARATMFGYTGTNDSETFARDHALYNAINTRFQAHGGGANLESASHDSLNDRLEEMSGRTIEDEATLQNLLFGEIDGTIVGMLKCDSQKILCGSTHILQGAQDDPFAVTDEYTLNQQNRFGYSDLIGIVSDWAGNWFLSSTKYEMILSGGSGWIHADEWFYEAFGSIDPINQEYITLGLNQQGAWGLVYGDVVDLDSEVTATLFSGPHRITGDFAMDFLYGEVMGYSVPMDENFIPSPGGTVHVWDEALVAQIYNLDNNSANALRWLFSYTVFDQFLEPLLETFLDVVPYKTQSVNQWLFGWEDPLSGWVSLEKNATYFGCGDSDVDGPCSTNSASVYSVYTGAVGGHNPGQIIAEDGDIHLPWRTPARNASAYGLLDPIVQTGAVGSYYDSFQPATANLGGYAVTTSEITGKGSVHGIETQTHTFAVNPLENPIQAKLLAQENVLDIFPGALPVYFGGEVVMQMEPTVDAAIAGDLTSYFYLDTRGIGAVDPTIDDLQPVFQISQSSSMTEAQSEDFKSLVITNTQPYSYWANLDSGADQMYIDQITMVIWILGIVSLLACSYVAKTSKPDNREIDWGDEE